MCRKKQGFADIFLQICLPERIISHTPDAHSGAVQQIRCVQLTKVGAAAARRVVFRIKRLTRFAVHPRIQNQRRLGRSWCPYHQRQQVDNDKNGWEYNLEKKLKNIKTKCVIRVCWQETVGAETCLAKEALETAPGIVKPFDVERAHLLQYQTESVQLVGRVEFRVNVGRRSAAGCRRAQSNI